MIDSYDEDETSEKYKLAGQDIEILSENVFYDIVLG